MRVEQADEVERVSVRTTWILIGVVQSGKGAISEMAEII
jgi:hypothetical protein